MKKCIFEAPLNEIRCVLGIKELKFNGKNRSKFSHLLLVRAEVADPPTPLTVSLSVKYPFSFPLPLPISPPAFTHSFSVIMEEVLQEI